jgi:hypothetical protein
MSILYGNLLHSTFGNNGITRKKPVPVPLRPPQISNRLICGRTRIFGVLLPAINRLSHGTAFKKRKSYTLSNDFPLSETSMFFWKSPRIRPYVLLVTEQHEDEYAVAVEH